MISRSRPDSKTEKNAGRLNPMTTASMTITTMTSMKVKPPRLEVGVGDVRIEVNSAFHTVGTQRSNDVGGPV